MATGGQNRYRDMREESSRSGSKQFAIVVDDIFCGTEGSICVYRDGSKHQIFVLQNGSDYVYVYKNNIRKATLHLPAKCQCMCVTADVGGIGRLLCGLCDGRIIQHDLELFKDEPKFKKEKRDGHQVKQTQTTTRSFCASYGEDIFGELLQRTEVKHSPSYALPSTEFSLENVTFLGDCHVLLEEPNIQDLLLVKNSLITCVQGNTGWTLSVYRCHYKVNFNSQDAAVSPHMAKNSLSRTSRTFIPMNETTPSECSDRGPSNYSESSQHFVRGKLQLFCIISQSISKSTKLKPSDSGHVMVIEDGLYNQLFGEDTNFLDTAVILICLPDGRIFYTPVRIYGRDPATPSNVHQSVPACSSEHITHCIGLFHILDQPVASVHSVNTRASETEHLSENAGNCVCIVGRFGQVTQITENSSPEAKEKLHIFENFVKGPVWTTCKVRAQPTLLYSTGKEVVSVCLPKSSQEATSTSGRSVISTSSLASVVKIVAMTLCSSASKHSKRSLHLMALTSDGRVLKVHLPTEGLHAKRVLPITAEQAGKRVDGLLKAINTVSDRSAELAKLAEMHDRSLQDGSQVCHLASLLTSDPNRHDVLTVKTVCTSRSDGGLCYLELLCQLTNHSHWILSHGWSLTVSIDVDPDWTIPERDWKCHASKSVPLVNLEPTHMVSVVIPVSYVKVPVTLPIQVQCFLHFSPKNITHVGLQEDNDIHGKSHFKMNETGVSLLIAQQKTVDLLSFSGPAQSHPIPISGSEIACVQDSVSHSNGCKWLESVLQNALKLRPTAGGFSSSHSEVNKMRQYQG